MVMASSFKPLKLRARTKLVLAAPITPHNYKELDILHPSQCFDAYLEPPCVKDPVSPTQQFQVRSPIAAGTPTSTLLDDTPFAPVVNNTLRLNIAVPQAKQDEITNYDHRSTSSMGQLVGSPKDIDKEEGIDFEEVILPRVALEESLCYQPEGFVDPDPTPTHVYRLKKALYNVSKPLPLGGQPGQVTIQADFFFNKDMEYLRYGSKGGRPALSISKMKEHNKQECNIAAMYGISHWWFQRQRFYIGKHTSEGDHRAVQTHMRILSVVRIEVFSLYGYDYMKTIVLCRVDLNEYSMRKGNFTTMRSVLIESSSYQTQLNLTKPRWDATGFEFKHDFTVIDSPRAVTFRDKYGFQMIMRFNEIPQFRTTLAID
ncbi:hypothetical protein Tco_0601234 [Tanacetum coccineum]